MAKVEDFDTIKIRLASPQEILSWSHGEVTKPETINYRTQRPEKDGLFCEKIFGPTRDYECYCGKYHGVRYKGVVCDKCGVEVTKSSVRRERLGHIKLASPVVNIWFLRGVPSRIGLLLSRSMQQIEKVVYFMSYIIVEVDEEAKKKILSDIQTEFDRKKKGITKEEKQTLKEEAQKAKDELAALKKGTILSENDYQRFSLKYGECFWALTGAEAIKKLLEEIDLQKLEKELEVELEKSSSKKASKAKIKFSSFNDPFRSKARMDVFYFFTGFTT